MLKFPKGNEKGFTLIELLIVVAIIGILAAIAIPQFAAYRVRSFNSATQSDTRNMGISQATLFTDFRVFGLTGEGALPGAGGPGLGAVAIGGNAVMDHITGTDANAVAQGLQIPVSSGVTIVASSQAGGVSFTTVAKHVQGDTYIGTDSDTTNFYGARGPLNVGIPMVATVEPAPLAGDQFGLAPFADPQAYVFVVQ